MVTTRSGDSHTEPGSLASPHVVALRSRTITTTTPTSSPARASTPGSVSRRRTLKTSGNDGPDSKVKRIKLGHEASTAEDEGGVITTPVPSSLQKLVSVDLSPSDPASQLQSELIEDSVNDSAISESSPQVSAITPVNRQFVTPMTKRHTRFGSAEAEEADDTIVAKSPDVFATPNEHPNTSASDVDDDGDDAPEVTTSRIEVAIPLAVKPLKAPNKGRGARRARDDGSDGYAAQPSILDQENTGHTIDLEPRVAATDFEGSEGSAGLSNATITHSRGTGNKDEIEDEQEYETSVIPHQKVVFDDDIPTSSSQQARVPSNRRNIPTSAGTLAPARANLPNKQRSSKSHLRFEMHGRSKYRLESSWNNKRSSFIVSG